MSTQKRRGRQPGQPPQPQWQPIDLLPMLAIHIDGMLEADTEHYQTLLEAKPTPHVLDDSTLHRVKKAFTTQKNDFWLFEEQLQRWQAEPLTDEQRAEIVRLVEQMKALRENTAKVLALAEELSRGTIDTVMGIDYLLRMMREQ